MFRRSRFSVRPNVGTAGRTAATPQEAPVAKQEANETPSDVSESISGPAVTPSEKDMAPGDGSDQIGEGSSSSAAIQRRKRFSVKPKVAPGRPATLARMPKCPVNPVSEPPVEASGSDFDNPTSSSQCGLTAASQGLGSPKRRRPSGDVKQAKVQPKPTPIPSESSANSTKDSLKQTCVPADSGKRLQGTSGSQVKEAPPRVPPFIPDKEAIELSEKAKTLVSSKSRLSLSPSALSLSRLLNDPSDLQRLAKAQKLKELLREERHKEKRLKKAKTRVKEYTLDPAKMTMRDLIHYVPLSNPMMSTLEHSAQENETVLPTSPGRQDRSPERAQQPEVVPKIMSPREEEDEEADEEQEEALMVPQVKVAEDGSLIIDEESLTVEVQRAKGPNPAQDRDPIFERGSTTTYSSFRKGTCSKPWSSEETDMFFLAISMVGTDFSMICQLFPQRARAEIKNKFKKEERENTWRIDKAFRERRKLDIEYFSKLLEKILEVQKNRKKLKSLAQKNSPKKQKGKAKGKKAARNLSDVEEEDENPPDLEEEREKENELCNEGETTAPKPKQQRKRKTGKDVSNKEPSNKKHETGEKSSELGEPSAPEAEAALPEDPKTSDISEKTENADAKDTAVKPAKLSRGRAPKAPLLLGRKWGKKVPPLSTKAKDSGDESASDGATKQINKDASPARFSANNENSSDEVAAVPPPRPTRYGRVPKPTKPLIYLCKENEHSSASETTPSSPVQHTTSAAKPKPKCTAKRGRSPAPQSDHESKKPKLVTLRATQSDYSDEENEQQQEQEEVEEEQDPACSPSKDSTAPAFVPASLRSPHSKISMVEETMEELVILANVPDVLGISQDALCPDASCEQAQNETGITEPCEHQLDLLVDVIDFLSSEQTEGSEDESYNEAAQTLLTIGNLTHPFQAPQNQIATQDHITGATSNSETSQLLAGEIPSGRAALEQSATHCKTAASCFGVTENTGAVAYMELQAGKGDSGDIGQIRNEQWTNSDANTTSQLQSSPESLKKKYTQTESVLRPDLSQCSRTAQLKSQSETSTIVRSVTESAPEETTPECSPLSLKDISLTEIKLSEELSGSHERSDSKIASGAVNQCHCSSDWQFEPSMEHINKETGSVSHAEIIERGSNLASSEISVTEPHFEQGSSTDSVAGQKDDHQSASFVASSVEDLPVSQKAESEVASSSQPRRSLLQKVRPKPNLPQARRATRSKPQIAKDSVEKAGRPTPIPKTTGAVEPEQSCATPPEKPVESTDPVSESSLDLGAKSTEELFKADEKNAHDGLQVGLGSAASGGSSSENKNLTEDNFHPSIPVSESKDEKLVSQAEIIKSGSNVAVSERSVTEPQVEQESVPVQEGSHPCAGFVEPVGDLSVSQNAESEVASSRQSRRSRLQRVKANLPQSQRSAQSKLQTSKDSKEKDEEPEQTCATPAETIQSTVPASDFTVSLDLASVLIPAEEISSTEVKTQLKTHGVCGQVDSSEAITVQCVSEKQNLSKVQVQIQPSGEQAGGATTTHSMSSTEYRDNTIAEGDVQPTCNNVYPEKSSQSLDSSSESSESNVPLRKWRSLKVKPKPNLASLARTTRSKLHPKGIGNTSEQCHLDTSLNVPTEQQSAYKNSAQSELKPSDKDGKNLSSVRSSLKTEVLDSTKSTASEMKTSLDGTSHGGISSTKSNIISSLTTNADSTPDPKESGQQSCQKSDPEDNSRDAVQQCFETSEVSQTSYKSPSPHRTEESQSNSAGTSTSLRKAPPPHRGRLLKPRPNLQRSSQRSLQNTTRAEADSGTFQKPVSEPIPDKEPVEGAVEQQKSLDCRPDCAVEQLRQPDSPLHDAESSLGCLTQVSSTQNVSTSSSDGTQSHPCVTLFSDMLSEQVPSDPDEPFFILSLTEIPVCSSGEVVGSAAESLSYLPGTDASIPQQSSLTGETLGAAAGDASLSDAPVLMSKEESGEMSLINVNHTGLDQTTSKDLIMKNPVDEHVHSSKAVENKNDSEIRPTEQRLRGTGRGAKMQVKPTRTRAEPASKTFSTKTIQGPSQLESSVEPEACDATANAVDKVVTEPQKGSDDQVDIRKETLTCAKDSSSGAPTQITETSVASSRSRKPKDSTAFSSVPAPGKAVSTTSKLKNPGAPGKPSSTTPHNVAPTPSPDEACSTLSTTLPTQTVVDVEQQHASGTSHGTAEVSASQQSDNVPSSLMEEEPTNVSQYFLSDIFTDVEEG